MDTSSMLALAAAAALLLLAALLAALAWRREGHALAIGDAPTLSAADVVERHRARRFGQPVELIGTVACDAPLRAPFSETLCVAYAASLSEEHERKVGRGLARREVETEGHDHQSGRVERFFVHDASGRVAVDPAGASLDMVETMARLSLITGAGGSERETWRQEWALPLGQRVYVLGYLGDAGGEPILMRHPLDTGRSFLISHRDEGALLGRMRRHAYGLYLAAGMSGGLGLLLGGVALFVL